MPLPKDNLFYALPLTDEQKIYVDSIFDNRFTIVNAKSGSGKTTLAIGAANILIHDDNNDLDGLVYTFTTVEEKKLGYSDGGIEKKESKYITPLLDGLNAVDVDPRFALKRETNNDQLNSRAWIEAKSHVFMRGTNILNKVVIIDEAQNFTSGELRKLLTRIHDSCKVIMIGHDGQIDIEPSKSGFNNCINHFENQDYVKVCNLSRNFRGQLANHADKPGW